MTANGQKKKQIKKTENGSIFLFAHSIVPNLYIFFSFFSIRLMIETTKIKNEKNQKSVECCTI